MFNFEITFRYRGRPVEEDVSTAIYSLLSGWERSGQVLHTEDALITFGRDACVTTVACPERTSLSGRNEDKWVRQHLAELTDVGLHKPKTRLLGKGIESDAPDPCKRPPWFLLMTDFVSFESPLRCGQHDLPVPLYRIAPTCASSGNFEDLIAWQRNWRRCDGMQMACGAGERFATRQISRVDSALTVEGRELARRIETQSGVPTYYYLYRDGERSVRGELTRPCPDCGGRWLLGEGLHGRLDFKCDRCRLVSNIAWSTRGRVNAAARKKASAGPRRASKK